MLSILQDAARWPRGFCWFGAIPEAEIEGWSRRNRITLPPDLIELWAITGGGDVFESETILRPTVLSPPNECFVKDDIESANRWAHSELNHNGLYIFQRGVFSSAIRLHDQKFVTLTEAYKVENEFSSLNEWYEKTLRAEFGERYGLVP